MPSTSSAAAAAAAAALEAPVAGTTVDLSDVSDPTISTLWKRIYANLSSDQIGEGMIVCKAFKQLLPPLVKRIELPANWSSRSQAQKALQYIAATFTQLEELEISAEEPHGQPKLDFSGVNFPCLTNLMLRCQPLRSLNFTTVNTPKLESLSLDGCGEVGSFNLQLPNLERLWFEHCEVGDEQSFGSSLSACPKLESINAYKLWGLGGTLHEIKLPECTEISFYRSDDLAGLKLWAPKLAELELRACYSLECVRIMDDPEGTPLTPLRVNLINANIDLLSKRHLKQHPRVKAPGGKLITKERDDPRTAWFGDTCHHFASEDEDETADDDDDDDEGFGGGVGFGFMGGLAGMMVGGGGEDAGFVPMMHPLLQMMMGGGGDMFGPDGQMHPAVAQMMMHEGLMSEGEEDPFGSGSGDEDSEEEEWETDSGDGEEQGNDAEQVQQDDAADEGDEENEGREDDADDEEGGEGVGVLNASGLLAAMLMSNNLAAAGMMAAAMEGENEDGDGGDGGGGGGGSPHCVIEEVD